VTANGSATRIGAGAGMTAPRKHPAPLLHGRLACLRSQSASSSLRVSIVTGKGCCCTGAAIARTRRTGKRRNATRERTRKCEATAPRSSTLDVYGCPAARVRAWRLMRCCCQSHPSCRGSAAPHRRCPPTQPPLPAHQSAHAPEKPTLQSTNPLSSPHPRTDVLRARSRSRCARHSSTSSDV